MTMRRPRVTLTWAQSIDGSIAAEPGRALRLSGEESMRMTHQLRAEHEAILIGVGTLLADNPSLTVRMVDGENPQSIVLDSQLRSSADSFLVKNGAWIATTLNASQEKADVLVTNGAHVVRLPANEAGQVFLNALMIWLTDKNVETLMVEGGAQVIEAFLAADLVDRVIITIAPLFVGGLNPFHAKPIMSRLSGVVVEELGSDVVIRGNL